MNKKEKVTLETIYIITLYYFILANLLCFGLSFHSYYTKGKLKSALTSCQKDDEPIPIIRDQHQTIEIERISND